MALPYGFIFIKISLFLLKLLIPIVFIFILCIILIYLGFDTVPKIIFFLTANSSVCLYTLIIGESTYLYVYYLVFFIMPLIVINKKKYIIMAISLLLPIFYFFLTIILIDRYSFEYFDKENINIDINELIKIISFIFSPLYIFFFIQSYIKSSIEDYNKEESEKIRSILINKNIFIEDDDK